MKLRGFIFGAVAAIVAFAACQKEPVLDTSKFELSQKTLNFTTAAGSQTITLTSGKTWKVEYAEGVEWVSITPGTGSASAEPQNITVTVVPNDGYERSTTVTFTNGLMKEKLTVNQAGDNESVETVTLDPTKTYAFRKADKVVSGQWYVMVATKNDKLWACNDPSSDASNFANGYAYPKGIEVEDVNGEVSVTGGAAYLFKASADGFTLMNNATNKYVLQTGTHVSFNLGDAPAAGAYWDITKNADGTFKILNKAVSKFIVMQTKYDSFGLSQYEDGGTMPWLYEYVGEGVAPEYKEMTIDQFYTTSESYVTVKAEVVAVGAKTMVLNDGTNKSLYVFVDADPGVNVGDVVKVDGLKSTYGKSDAGYTQLKQLKNVTITKISDNIEALDLPALALTTEQIDAPYSNEATSLVTIEGTVVKDGNYINLQLDGAVLGSVVESAKGSELPEGVRLSITGYYAGINSKGYFCILPTAYDYSNTPFFNVPTTNLEVSASTTSATITVKGNVDWNASCETAGFTLDKNSGNGDATITVTFAANETEEAKIATVKLSTSADVPTTEYTVTITQKAPAAAGSVEKIDRIENLTAGTYFMAAYLTIDSNKSDLSAAPYHIWNGTIDSGDCVTVSCSYTDGVLDPQEGYEAVELVAVSGKANTYYVKLGAKYLYSSASATNRKLALCDTPAEWVATDNANGGITLSSNAVYMGSASAASKFIRSYKAESTLKYGLVFFKEN